MIGDLRPTVATLGCLDRPPSSTEMVNKTRKLLPQTKWRLMTGMRAVASRRGRRLEGFRKRACPCCVPIDLAKCEIRCACLPSDQQPERVAEIGTHHRREPLVNSGFIWPNLPSAQASPIE